MTKSHLTRILLLNSVLFFVLNARTQVICIWCFDQNEPISSPVTNLIQNGSFETTDCSTFEYFCPNSSSYNGCTFPNWTVSGGGPGTYAQTFNTSNSIIPDGSNAVYLGNSFCKMCSEDPTDFSCIETTNCFVSDIGLESPINDPYYGGSTGVSISQTVSGLTIGNNYFLEFWSGGEGFGFPDEGVFGLSFGFGNYLMTNIETYPGMTGTGKRYLIEFKAIATSHTIKFTNWGHICTTCTEAIFDDVKMYAFSEVEEDVVLCDQNDSIPSTLPDTLNTPDTVDPNHPTDPFEFYIPNVLTPNDDQVNDEFTIKYNGSETYHLVIVNRWGETIFMSNSSTSSWNGKIGSTYAKEGVYFYTLTIGEKVHHGFLTLIK